MSEIGRLIAVIGSRGGAGTSCLAVAIAKALYEQTSRAVLVDLCDGAAGLEVLLGIENEPGARWPDLETARGEVAGADLVRALPQWSGLPVLSMSRHDGSGMSDDVVLDVCAGLLRDGVLVVLDLPAPAAWTLPIRALLADADQVLIATPDSVAGVAGAFAIARALNSVGRAGVEGDDADGHRRARRSLRPNGALALRSRSGSRVTEQEVSKLVGMPVMVRFRDDRNLAAALELGIGPVARVAKHLTRAGKLIAGEVVAP